MTEKEKNLLNDQTEQSRHSVSPESENSVQDVANKTTKNLSDDDEEETIVNRERTEASHEMLEEGDDIIFDAGANDYQATPHDAFDWEAGNDMKLPYSNDEMDRLTQMYDSTFKEINDQEIVDGVVESITPADVVLNIGFKSDGLVSRSEFRDLPNLRVGDRVEVYVEQKEDENGQLILSRRKARLTRAWDKIVQAYNENMIIQGQIISKTKGGLIVDAFGLETFLPGSQIDVKPITDYDWYVGKSMEFKVVKINEIIKNAVLSHKALIESGMEQQRLEIISKLEKGQVIEGTIKNITDFGAFVDLGGVDGLLYITDISWGRINHPSEVLEREQKLNVVVLDFDDNKKRISLGLKQLQPHPWEVLDNSLDIGSKVKGKIVNIEDYGAFLEITPGVEGLIHVSEISWSNQPINSRDFFNLNDEYEAIVVTIDRNERKMSLSLKQLLPDPWENIQTKYPINSKHTGIVRNITPYGVFVELEDGIGGMVHISDLSWLKRFNHPSEYTKVGENLEVIVLDIDAEGRKMALGHRQIEEDPWDTFETVFPVGSIHQGTIVKKDDKGAIVALPYGLEAFVSTKHLKKEDNEIAALDEVLDFVIIEFNRDDKKIVASHSETYRKERAKEEEAQKAEVEKEAKKTSDNVKNINSGVEKSTLGDLDVLSKLKKKMEESEKDK
ncbi:MAG: 30S ribosomal protein S1 [Chitinophagales bacterium]